MEIKEKVYELLWELFKDECPYFNFKSNNLADTPQTRLMLLNSKSQSESYQIWTILNEILPDSIWIKRDSQYTNTYDFYFSKSYIPNSNLKPICLYYGKPIDDILLWSMSQSNIFQAILSLLEAIKNHKDKDKFVCKWGE
jgi:hypothetical protein